MINLMYFFRKKNADPASSLYETKRWISALPLKDEYQAHRMLVNALNLFNSSTEPLNKERLKVLMRLDDGSQAMQHSLCLRYFENRDVRQNVEQTLWKEIYALYWHMAQGYQAFIREYLDDLENHETRKELPLITARALHYCAMEIKWRYFHQEPIQPAMWKRLHKLYRLSESHGFANAKVKLDVDGMTGTCMQIYISILMLDMLAPTSLRPAQIEQIEIWLKRWGNTMSLDNHRESSLHTHGVDLSNTAGACKLIPNMEWDKPRFWNIRPFLDKLGLVVKALQEGRPTDRFGIGRRCKGKECLELLEQMSSLWMRSVAARIYPRDAADEKMVEVLCGIDMVLASLEGVPPEQSCANSVTSMKWPLKNESDHGYGLSLDAASCNHATIGKLVGLRQLDDPGKWLVCALRWMSNVTQDQVSMGLEKLSDAPRVVSIQPLLPSDQLDVVPSAHVMKALFLPNVDAVGMSSSLVVPTAEFATNRLLDLHDQNLAYKIRLTVVLEKSEDWSRVKFDIMGRRTINV